MRKRRRRANAPPPPIPLEPVDLLAGLAPGVELGADDLPAGIADAPGRTPASVTVNDVGRLLRSGEPTVGRLIRTPLLRPSAGATRQAARPTPRPPDKPGE